MAYDIADAVELLETDERLKLYEILGDERTALVFYYLENVDDFVSELEYDEVADIIEQMDADDAIDILEELDEEDQEEIIKLQDEEIVEEMRDRCKSELTKNSERAKEISDEFRKKIIEFF